MYPSEIVLLVALLALLIAQNVQRLGRSLSLGCFAIALVTALLSGALGQARWQMAPAYVLFAVLSLLLLRRAYSHIVVRAAGIVLGALLLAISVVLSLALPVVTLPAPDGPHVVGSRSFWLRDESRNDAYFGVPDAPRELYAQAWYPATLPNGEAAPRVKTMWEQLYREERDVVSFLTGYLRGVETHSYADAPLAAAQAPYPLIVFSHGTGLLAEQNTPLMEHLASHGYIVLAIGHTRLSMRVVSPDGRTIPLDFAKMNAAMEEYGELDPEEFDARARRAETAEEAATIQLELGERATKMNELMAIWVADLKFVLDEITAPSGASPALEAFLRGADRTRIGLLGMSFGGGAVTELCKFDARCHAGLNLDGGLFGSRQRQPLKVPFLGLISAGNERYNEYLLLSSENDYYEVLVEGATHGDYFDMVILMPFMKWLGLNGSIEAERVIEIVNHVSLRFFDAYVRGRDEPRFDRDEFPELRVETNEHARR